MHKIVTKEIALTRQQASRIWRREYRRSPAYWLVATLATVLPMLLVNVGDRWWPDLAIHQRWGPVLALAALWFLLLVGVLPWLLSRSLLPGRLLAPGRLIFTPDAVEQELKDGSWRHVPYIMLGRVVRRPGHVLLFDRKGGMIVVPYGAFSTKDEANRATSLLLPNA